MMKISDFINKWTGVHIIINLIFGLFGGYIYFLCHIDIRNILILIILLWELFEQTIIVKKIKSWKESNIDILMDVIVGFCFIQIGFYLYLYLF